LLIEQALVHPGAPGEAGRENGFRSEDAMDGIMTVRRGTTADIPFIMQTERLEGYGELVGRWDTDQHASALADPRYAFFIAEADGWPVGFSILRDWASSEQVTLVKRVAVARPGAGLGKAMMRAIVDTAFAETDVYRLWIGCFPDNLRARRAYEAVGFVAEGVARGNAFFLGKHRDELILAMLRPDWEVQLRSGSVRKP
jgi:GNAT superfamily N-acetyltransferase